MIITLKQSQIEEALVQYMQGKGLDTQNRQVEVSFTAGRGQNGLMATMEFGDFQKPEEPVIPSGPVVRNIETADATQPDVEEPDVVTKDARKDEEDAAPTASTEAPKKNIFAGQQ